MAPNSDQNWTNLDLAGDIRHHDLDLVVLDFTTAQMSIGGGTIKPNRILVIESDESLASVEAAALEEAGYSVVRGFNALDGLKKLYETHPDLIIVARELPMTGEEEPCLRIRQASYLPIIVLGSEEDAVETLELGADAYMARPPSLIELVARVNALLRRKQSNNPPGDSHKPDTDSHLPKESEDGPSGLTRTEFRLASCLILNNGRLLGHSQLISEVWGGKRVGLATLHFYIRRLRKKLAIGSIFGVRGYGYCFREVTGPGQ